MATQTTNLGLIKPGLTDKIRIAQINGNMDVLDNVIGAVGNTSLQTQMSNAQSSVSALQDGLAIVSNNNAHPAIAQGQYVYVKNHGSLDEGLYVATTAIAANGTLSASNLTADSGGGLNTLSATLSEQIVALQGKITDASKGTIDLNNYKSTGMYSYNGNTSSNAPSTGSSTLIVIKYSNDYVVQIVSVVRSTVTEMWVRNFYNGTTWSTWSQLVTKTNQLSTLTLLFEFTGTSEQQISVSGGRNIDSYALVHFDLFDTNGNIIASLCASPRMLRGQTKHYIYAGSTSTWATFGFINDSQNITVNRTSSTTSKFRCYGID